VEVDQGQRDRHPEKPIEKPETVGSDGGDGHDDEMQRLSKGGVAPSSKTEDHATGWGLTSTAEDPGSGVASSPLYKVQPRTRGPDGSDEPGGLGSQRPGRGGLLRALRVSHAGLTDMTNTVVNTVYANIPGSSSRTTSAWSTGIPAWRACSIIASTLGASYSQ
jgi:hypothetical protein